MLFEQYAQLPPGGTTDEPFRTRFNFHLVPLNWKVNQWFGHKVSIICVHKRRVKSCGCRARTIYFTDLMDKPKLKRFLSETPKCKTRRNETSS